jgi:hypothetical protein
MLDDITMAALSGASSHYDIAHGHDCDCRWRRACPIVGLAGPLPDGHPVGALALVWRPLGRDYGLSTGCALAFPSRVACKFLLAFRCGSLVAGLSIGMGLTAIALAGLRPAHYSAWWWLGGLAFIGIELATHLVLQVAWATQLYNGRG